MVVGFFFFFFSLVCSISIRSIRLHRSPSTTCFRKVVLKSCRILLHFYCIFLESHDLLLLDGLLNFYTARDSDREINFVCFSVACSELSGRQTKVRVSKDLRLNLTDSKLENQHKETLSSSLTSENKTLCYREAIPVIIIQSLVSTN